MQLAYYLATELRKWLMENNESSLSGLNMCIVFLVDQMLLLLLDSDSRDLVYSSCGVLTVDHMYRSILSNNSAMGRSVNAQLFYFSCSLFYLVHLGYQ